VVVTPPIVATGEAVGEGEGEGEGVASAVSSTAWAKNTVDLVVYCEGKN
jgi:hypothetical protein